MRNCLRTCAAVALAAGLLVPSCLALRAQKVSAAAGTQQFDLVIRNGRVMDPATGFDRAATNVGIRHGTVAAITSSPISGKTEIDATGLIVAPGFIDLISYDLNSVGARNKVFDGVTTNLALHGGTSRPAAWYGRGVRYRPPLHFGASFFYSEARNRLAIPSRRPANEEQIQKLVATAEDALQQGALGISFALEYVPGISSDEILPLMRLAKRYDVPVFFHARYSAVEGPKTSIDGLQEILGYARQTQAAVHITHIHSTGGTLAMPQALQLLAAAREEGLDITADVYPYNFWATRLDSARLDQGWQRRFQISYGQLQLAGSTERLTPESFRRYRRQGKIAVAYAMPEADVVSSLQCPFVMIASDGILEPGFNNHPRSSGTFARTIGKYVREEKAISLMDALAKMTILPARRLERHAPAFRRKGRLNVGADADIVVFDYGRVTDRATVEHPEYPSAGIEYVVVSGIVAKTPEGLVPGAHAGNAIKSDLASVALAASQAAKGKPR